MVWNGYDPGDETTSEIFFWDGTTTQITNNSAIDNHPAISGGNVAWQGWVGSETEIYSWDSSAITRITNNTTYDWSPAISGDNVVWSGDADGDYDIYLWDGATTTQITVNDTYEDGWADISGSNVVWSGWDGSDPTTVEIFFWDGATTTQITNNSTTDSQPAISGSNVVWVCDTEICLWDGGIVTQITDNSSGVSVPDISGLNVVWRGSDGSDTAIYMTTIPEPSTALLLAFGLAGLAAGRRRKGRVRATHVSLAFLCALALQVGAVSPASATAMFMGLGTPPTVQSATAPRGA